MAENIHNRITEKNPRNDAQPSIQTANNMDSGTRGNTLSGMTESDKLIYQLVKNSVDYCGNQFGENLQFNSEVLTNVLYDNIYKILGEKFNGDEFVNNLVENLLKNGCVVKQESSSSSSQPKEEIVETIDPKQLEDIRQRLSTDVKLLQARKLEIFKIFSDIDGDIKSLDQMYDVLHQENERMRKEKDEAISQILGRIKDNGEKMDGYVTSQSEDWDETEKRLDELQKSMRECIDIFNGKNVNAPQKKIFSKLNDFVSNVFNREQQRDVQQNQRKSRTGFRFNPKIVQVKDVQQSKQIQNPQSFFDETLKKLTLSVKNLQDSGKGDAQKQTKLNIGNIVLLSDKKNQAIALKRKPTLKRKIEIQKRRIGRAISNSIVGRTYRGVKGVVKGVYGAGKAVGKGFAAASYLTGKTVVGAASLAIGGVKKVVELKKSGQLKQALITFAPAQIIGKIGWRAIKWVGKKIWSGIKKVIFKVASIFGALFKIGGKFVNKVSNWKNRLVGAVKDKKYRFLVEPISSMMVTVFGFVTGVVMSPIKFMKWLVPAVFDRIRDALHSISQGVKSCLKATWGIFKRILFNPITITLLIGGLFYFFGPKLLNILTGGIQSIKETLIPTLVSVAKGAWNFLKQVWGVLSWVGSKLFSVVEWITDPDGAIAKFVVGVVKTFLSIKRFITDMVKASGKDSIDALCMFLSGDLIGLFFHYVTGVMVSLWKWLRNTPFMRKVISVIKAVGRALYLIGRLPTLFYESLGRAAVAGIKALLGKGDFSDIIDQLVLPYKNWWKDVKELFGGDDGFTGRKDAVTVDPLETNLQQRSEVNASMKSLNMSGFNFDEKFANLDKIQRYAEYATLDTSVREKLEASHGLYVRNSQAIDAYNQFIEKVWEMGKGNDDIAQQVMRILLESPDLSQKLMSAFFYYDPGTGKTYMLRPVPYIGQFIQNIRKAIADPNRQNAVLFAKLLNAFKQVNAERGIIVNKQGDIIKETIDAIKTKSGENLTLYSIVRGLNEGTLFTKGFLIADDADKGNWSSAALVQDSFQQIQMNNAYTRYLTGVDGKEFGTNDLLKVDVSKEEKNKENNEVILDNKAFQASYDANKSERQQMEEMKQVVLPSSMTRPVQFDENEAEKAMMEENDMRKRWQEHLRKREELISEKHMNESDVERMGYGSMTYQQFKDREKNKKPPPKETDELAKYNSQQLAGLRLQNDIETYHKQGKLANEGGFKLGREPSILTVQTDGLQQHMYMFSPEWRTVYGTSKMSDLELVKMLKRKNPSLAQEMQKSQQIRQQKKEEEEEKRRKEEQILDYSAKIVGGYIEVKLGEDVDAMRQAWYAHLRKREELISEKHMLESDVDKMGFINYNWENWKRYYRKMHGMPEDGIRRIPYDGERKKRDIDWNERYALSTEELAKYGIEMSKDGPTMIPIDKAMQIANSLFQGAKTIYSIRDGLEVMSQGLKTEADILKRRREGGQPMAVVQTGDGAETTPIPAPPNQSQYAAVG